MLLHPASVLIGWSSLLVLFQLMNLSSLVPSAVFAVFVAVLVSRPVFFAMLRRSRWLLLTISVLFATMTPGALLSFPWSLGVVTDEGVKAAFEQMLRLLSMLAWVAVLVSGLGRPATIAGIHSLLFPLRLIGVNRDAIALRLMLTLDCVALDNRNWLELLFSSTRESATSIYLPFRKFRATDVIFSGAMVVVALTVWSR